MRIRHDIYAAVAAMGATGRVRLVSHFVDKGHSRKSVQTTISDMVGSGQLMCGPGRALNRTLRAGRAPILRASAPVRPASLAHAPPAGRARVHEPDPALQPIWPAVAGAPTGGLRPCIA